jgi:hypothetical protein
VSRGSVARTSIVKLVYSRGKGLKVKYMVVLISDWLNPGIGEIKWR